MLFKKISFNKIIFLVCLLIFCFLLFKDPFSQRSLIPNFEPVPDAFHYVIPAINFVKGEGFNISREGRFFPSQVGPLYSFILIPFYFINQDPRVFYFTNIIMAILSFILFYKILGKITDNTWIIAASAFLYITNYDLYWYPTLAMAENLMLLIFLIAVYLLLLPIKYINVIGAIIIALSFYMAKYASAPLTMAYLFVYGVKVYFNKGTKKYFIIYILLGTTILLFSSAFFYLFRHINIIDTFFSYIKGIIANVYSRNDIFSARYIPLNLPRYLDSLVGNPTRVLWDATPLVPKIVGIFGLLGLILGMIKSEVKNLSFSLLILLTSSVLFMSTFYAFDARYILQAIPTLILGFTIFLVFLSKFILKGNLQKVFYILILIFFVYYLFGNGLRLKNQIMLNLRYTETPWYYVSVLEMNKYFTTDKIQNQKKPILISAMAPFLIDFFSNGNYTLLPLSYNQEFRDAKEIVWGPNDYSDLLKLYTKYLNDGYNVYVSRYGLGNEVYTNHDFQEIIARFDSKLVAKGCYEQCNIYKLSLKKQIN